jgi:hypothetical protein
MATIDKQMLRNLRTEIDAALVAVAKAHNLKSLTAGNCSFDPVAGQFTFKVTGIAADAIGKEAALYISPDAAFLGLPPLGTKFRSGLNEYATAGLKSSGSKVVCSRVSDGKLFLFKVQDVLSACARAAVPA